MNPSAVSHAVRSVEDRLGIPLFARTTRSVSLTEAGARFIGGVEPALTDIGKAVEGLTPGGIEHFFQQFTRCCDLRNRDCHCRPDRTLTFCPARHGEMP